MVNFVTIFQRLEAIGLTDVLLPFILIFAVVFAILETVKIFGEKGKNINIIVAVCLGLLVVIPHVTGSYPPGSDVVDIINSSIPNVAAVIIALVMMMILIGVFGVRLNLEKQKLGGVVAVLALLIVLFIFGSSAGWFRFGWPRALSFMDDSDTLMIIIVLIIFGLIVAFITHESPDDSERAARRERRKEAYNDWFGSILERPGNK